MKPVYLVHMVCKLQNVTRVQPQNVVRKELRYLPRAQYAHQFTNEISVMRDGRCQRKGGRSLSLAKPTNTASCSSLPLSAKARRMQLYLFVWGAAPCAWRYVHLCVSADYQLNFKKLVATRLHRQSGANSLVSKPEENVFRRVG